jgi:hypothetical protein
MDAGLAAVLGASVGALGTGMTGLTVALLARNTAHRQVKAEAMRVLRESRRATYITFAETHERYLDLLCTTLTVLSRAERFPDQRDEWIANAHKHWKQALKYRQVEVQKVRPILFLDATRPVAEAALEMSESFALLSAATRRTIEGIRGEALDKGPITPPLPGYIEALAQGGVDHETPDLKVLREQAQEAYKAYLRTTADAIGEKSLLPPG